MVTGKAEFGRFTFTEDNILEYAREFDPQPFHVDPVAAAAGPYGGLIASGWQVACVCMRLILDARGPRVADPNRPNGASPGWRDMEWKKPVRPGDTLTFYREYVDRRPSASRPGWYILTFRSTADNQHGEEVFSYVGAAMMYGSDNL